MNHLDAKAIRERLNAISLAITTLEGDNESPRHAQIANAARQSLDDITVLVTDDELEEHASHSPENLPSERRLIREQSKTARFQPPAGSRR